MAAHSALKRNGFQLTAGGIVQIRGSSMPIDGSRILKMEGSQALVYKSFSNDSGRIVQIRGGMPVDGLQASPSSINASRMTEG